MILEDIINKPPEKVYLYGNLEGTRGVTVSKEPIDINSIPDGTIVYVGTPEGAAEYESANTLQNEANTLQNELAETVGELAETVDKVKSAVDFAARMANDNSHGYSQAYRWPEQGTSFDCSSLVITAYQQAGVPVRDHGASYTGNMLPAFLSCGFKDVKSQINVINGNGLKAGDVLLNVASHTCICVGNGNVVNARSSEGTSNQRDDSGNEIRVQSYWNYGWDYVLRLE